ncbi:hypothetical protein MTO96_017881 [Rhipicephalus appendiculatus]
MKTTLGAFVFYVIVIWLAILVEKSTCPKRKGSPSSPPPRLTLSPGAGDDIPTWSPPPLTPLNPVAGPSGSPLQLRPSSPVAGPSGPPLQIRPPSPVAGPSGPPVQLRPASPVAWSKWVDSDYWLGRPYYQRIYTGKLHPTLEILRPRPGEPGSPQNPGTIQPGPSQLWLASVYHRGFIPRQKLRRRNQVCDEQTICEEGTCCLQRPGLPRVCRPTAKAW